MIGNGSNRANNSGGFLVDDIDNLAGKTLEVMGSAAFLGLQAGNAIAQKAGDAAGPLAVRSRLSEEIVLMGADRVARIALGAAKRIFGRQDKAPVMVDDMEVPQDQLDGLRAIKDEDRELVVNLRAGSAAFSIVQQMRERGVLGDDPESPARRFRKIAVDEVGISPARASHISRLPDPSASLDPARQ